MEFVCLRNVNIKDEPDDYVENIESMEGAVEPEERTIVDVDPMNLLEPVSERASDDDQDKANVATNGDDEGTTDKWQNWIKTYPWLLRSSGKRVGFCLYCGKNLSVEGIYSLQRHDSALIHKERHQNYEAFLHSCKESLDEDGLSAIKKEVDEDNAERLYAELIEKRLARSKELNDYNWKNWLNAHTWLVRGHSEDAIGTKGYCKYCKCIFDAEFSLNRQRHEQAAKHRLGEKLFLNEANGTEPNSNTEVNSEITETANDKAEQVNNDENATGIESHVASKVLKGRLFDKVSSSSSQRCCRVCRVVMDKHSCRKHLKSKLHRRNMQALAISYRKDKKISICPSNPNNIQVDWSKYTKIHSWICADPDDPKYAYCSYCEKRFMYGLSTVKRTLHEKSQSHREAIKRKQENGGVESNNTTNKLEKKQQNEETNAELECDENERTANDSSLKRFIHFSKRDIYTDEWFELNPCYQRNKDNEDYIYCKCCKVLLLTKNLNIGKHERAERHRFTQNALAEEAKKEQQQQTNSQVSKEKHVSLSWIRRSRNGQTFCKFCRVVLSRKYRPAVHERTERHKFATQKFLARRKAQESKSLKTENNQNASPREEGAVSEEEMKPLMEDADQDEVNWHQKYVWLSFSETETREHYGYCNYCKQSVFVPTTKFASKHECTANHIRSYLTQQNGTENSKNPKTENTQPQVNSGTKFKLYKWLLPDPEENRSFGYCKFCKTRVTTEGLMALAHHNSRNHRKATAIFLQNHKDEGLEGIAQDSLFEDSASQQLRNLEAINQDESGSETSLATRLTNAHTEMLSLIREMKGNKTRQNTTLLSGPLSAAASLSPSDADICYSRVSEQHNGKLELNVLSQAKRERNTYDLFFESMNETVKRLPTDLAAESRVKIMQIVYDLEMRALKRKSQQSGRSPNTTPLSSRSTIAMRERSTSITNPSAADVVIPENEQSTNQSNTRETS
ncbi:protein suppressor of variegation 3-7 isoform X4 [Rhagoletis pomonella]|uniref:protein suppressor of variegation 3-7 isoform X4 n=1 Tax=Rhagoletis pomonella TaxID=28610 RepID=UPI001784968C|nr:protein suppressor of variegation 3-7 isoform X4 [Rhagoletis pomonella]